MAYIDIDLDVFSDDEIMEEAEARGLLKDDSFISGEDIHNLVEKIWMARRLGVSADEYVNELVYAVLGKIL